jgi:hypothetical protein
MNEHLTCDAYGCDSVIADDLGDGWVRVIGTLYLNRETGNLFCAEHAIDSTDTALEGETNLLTA